MQKTSAPAACVPHLFFTPAFLGTCAPTEPPSMTDAIPQVAHGSHHSHGRHTLSSSAEVTDDHDDCSACRSLCSVNVCICICMYIYVYICIHTYVYTSILVCMGVCIYRQTELRYIYPKAGMYWKREHTTQRWGEGVCERVLIFGTRFVTIGLVLFYALERGCLVWCGRVLELR